MTVSARMVQKRCVIYYSSGKGTKSSRRSIRYSTRRPRAFEIPARTQLLLSCIGEEIRAWFGMPATVPLMRLLVRTSVSVLGTEKLTICNGESNPNKVTLHAYQNRKHWTGSRAVSICMVNVYKGQYRAPMKEKRSQAQNDQNCIQIIDERQEVQ